MQQRGAEVEDWSIRATKRRMRVLWMLARPYSGRVALGIGSLLAATGSALAPPYLLKVAIDDGIRKGDLSLLGWVVAAFLGAGAVYFATSATAPA
jgi:ABC-type multidrug transport system fused ATPase/permease subunit